MMEQRGDLLIFPYPGGQITFHQDLKVYFSVRNIIYGCSSELLGSLSVNSEPQKNLDRLTQSLIRFIRGKILSSLHERKIYNVVDDDFVMGNPAYVEIFSNTQDFQRRKENAITQSAYEVQAKKDRAYNEAQSTITGLGYTLYSNSIVDHAIYASKSEEAIKKQAWKAQQRYFKAAQEIETAGK